MTVYIAKHPDHGFGIFNNEDDRADWCNDLYCEFLEDLQTEEAQEEWWDKWDCWEGDLIKSDICKGCDLNK